MLHGKSPGGPQPPNFAVLKTRLEREGMTVLMPDMPWSRTRYLQIEADHLSTPREASDAVVEWIRQVTAR